MTGFEIQTSGIATTALTTETQPLSKYSVKCFRITKIHEKEAGDCSF